VFGTVEAVKTVSDLFMPMKGTVVAFNEALTESPDLVNQDPYGEGWMIKIKIGELDKEELLDAEGYKSHIGA